MDSVYVINRIDIFVGDGVGSTTLTIYKTEWTIHKTEEGAIEMLKKIALDMGFELNNDGRSTQHKIEDNGWKESYYKIEKQKLFE